MTDKERIKSLENTVTELIAVIDDLLIKSDSAFTFLEGCKNEMAFRELKKNNGIK